MHNPSLPFFALGVLFLTCRALNLITICAQIVTEMRGADFIVFELMKNRNIHNFMRT